MSEYWKSTPKYWCKHCSTYVKDTPFERKQHENTGKHQGNLKRFLRGVQNDHERAERDKEKAKAEVDRLNKVVGGQDSSTSTSSSAVKPSSIRKSVGGALTAADQKRQWQQLADLGIAIPDNFRGEMAMPGQWQTVSNPNPNPNLSTEASSLNTGVRKRKAESDEQEDEDGAGDTVRRRGWGSTVRKYPEQVGPDLDVLLDESIVKKNDGPKKVTRPAENHPTFEKPALDTPSKELKDEEDTTAETEIKIDTDTVLPDFRQSSSKMENVEVERSTASSEADLRTASAPVFKKRKVKSKVGKETD